MTANRIVGVVEDLFFTVKITDAAKRAGMQIVYPKTEEAILSAAADARLVVIDLGIKSLQPLRLIEALKASTSAKLLAYVSHVQTEVRQRAVEAGCDVVLAKSAFTTNLPELLKQHAASQP